jgi:TetR/AcrR family transcriptional regulator, repressor for neighboring sulfatase
MSTNSLTSFDRRRKPEAVRKEALEVGRRLLIAGGPTAITLKAIGAEMAMSHANLIHHFGSAEAFQKELKTSMVEELTRNVTELIRHGGVAPDNGKIVDTVFTAYGRGGIGTLVAWLALSKSSDDGHELEPAIAELLAVIESLAEGPGAAMRGRASVLLVSALALGNSLFGKPLAKCVGSDPQELRDLTVWILEQLAVSGPPRTDARLTDAQLDAEE